MAERAIFSEGPRDRWVYWLKDLVAPDGAVRPLALSYRATSRQVIVGDVWKHQSAKDHEAVGRFVADVWEHIPTAEARLARARSRAR